jgi:ABC-type branched-subunit amino acid transport system ATPase component
MVEHNLSVVESLCDTITVLQRGQILAEGPTRRCPRTRACWKPTWEWKHEPRTQTGQPAGNEMLRITDLHAFYGESHILHGIDLQVNRG